MPRMRIKQRNPFPTHRFKYTASLALLSVSSLLLRPVITSDIGNSSQAHQCTIQSPCLLDTLQPEFGACQTLLWWSLNFPNRMGLPFKCIFQHCCVYPHVYHYPWIYSVQSVFSSPINCTLYTHHNLPQYNHGRYSLCPSDLVKDYQPWLYMSFLCLKQLLICFPVHEGLFMSLNVLFRSVSI